VTVRPDLVECAVNGCVDRARPIAGWEVRLAALVGEGQPQVGSMRVETTIMIFMKLLAAQASGAAGGRMVTVQPSAGPGPTGTGS
jgi:hypothetical protein